MFQASIPTPPGLQGGLARVLSGGDALEWLAFEKRKDYTNAFVIQNGKILLGYKKRGFGKHKYNGFGGKVEVGETSQQAARRELEEEAGITAPLKHAGTLLFTSGIEDVANYIEIYQADEYDGVIAETEEMRPEWFALPSADLNEEIIQDVSPIPFDHMWDTDRYWMPLLISRTKFSGRVDFTREGDVYTLHKWWFGTSQS